MYKTLFRKSIMDKIVGIKYGNQAKLERGRKLWISFCLIYEHFLWKFCFWKRSRALDTISTQFRYFPTFSYFHKALSLKSFGNSRGNFYTMFLHQASINALTVVNLNFPKMLKSPKISCPWLSLLKYEVIQNSIIKIVLSLY